MKDSLYSTAWTFVPGFKRLIAFFIYSLSRDHSANKGAFFAGQVYFQTVSLGLGPEEHYRAAIAKGEYEPFPMDAALVVDDV